MYIVNPDMESYHCRRIDVGTKGAFMEGARKVGICEVIKIHGLTNGIHLANTNG